MAHETCIKTNVQSLQSASQPRSAPSPTFLLATATPLPLPLNGLCLISATHTHCVVYNGLCLWRQHLRFIASTWWWNYLYRFQSPNVSAREAFIFVFSLFWGWVTGLNASGMLCKVSHLILSAFNMNMERFLKDTQRLKQPREKGEPI